MQRASCTVVPDADDGGWNAGSGTGVCDLARAWQDLQAIATARRLGAVVEAYDVRAAAGEQVRSLGGKFLDVDLGGINTRAGADTRRS